MSRYVEANWLLGVAGLSKGIVDVDDIYNAPSIDITFCKECKHWRPKAYFDINRGVFANMCARPGAVLPDVDADDFCSYGERSSDE